MRGCSHSRSLFGRDDSLSPLGIWYEMGRPLIYRSKWSCCRGLPGCYQRCPAYFDIVRSFLDDRLSRRVHLSIWLIHRLLLETLERRVSLLSGSYACLLKKQLVKCRCASQFNTFSIWASAISLDPFNYPRWSARWVASPCIATLIQILVPRLRDHV